MTEPARFPRLRAVALWSMVLAVLLVGLYATGYLRRTQVMVLYDTFSTIVTPEDERYYRNCWDTWGETLWKPAAWVEGIIRGKEIRLRYLPFFFPE